MSELSSRFPYFRYHRHQTNRGAEENLIFLSQTARGEYAWFFCDDDILMPGALEMVLPHVRSARHAFIMTNKTVKNRDLSKVVIERQNETDRDHEFSDILDLCREFGYFSQLGFASTAVFRRREFSAIDPRPYMGTYFPHAGIWLEAFHRHPCLFLSEVVVCQRQFNQRLEKWAGTYMVGPYALKTFRQLKEKGIIDYRFLEAVRERPLLRNEERLSEAILRSLRSIVQANGLITESEWELVFEVFFSLEGPSYRQAVLQLVADYVSLLTIDRVEGRPPKSRSPGAGTVPDRETIQGESERRFGMARLSYRGPMHDLPAVRQRLGRFIGWPNLLLRLRQWLRPRTRLKGAWGRLATLWRS